MMTLIIAILISLGAISTPQEATEQVIEENKTEIQAIIGDDIQIF